MTQCRIIGLTGGIATGKTTVANFIKKNYRLIDSDKIAKDIVNKGMKGYNMIVEYFGEDILLENRDIDRDKLANIIFNSRDKREALDRILHPLIFDEIEEELEKSTGLDYVFLDIPLLFENMEEFNKRGIVFYEIWLVYLDRDTQIERLMVRDSIEEEYAISKIESQMPLEDKLKSSDKIIYNNDTIEDLESYIEILLSKLN